MSLVLPFVHRCQPALPLSQDHHASPHHPRRTVGIWGWIGTESDVPVGDGPPVGDGRVHEECVCVLELLAISLDA